MRPSYASLCSVSNVFFFRETWQTLLQCFSHHQLANGFDCWQFVVNASRISQSYFALWGQRLFHWVWLCGQFLFLLLGLPPSFLASRASPLNARALARSCTPLTKSEEKERLLAVYERKRPYNILIVWRRSLKRIGNARPMQQKV